MLNSKNVNTNQKGFTLIELVVVIVILGILAVTAAPKFINLQSDAQTATLQAIKASMETATTLVHSKSLIAGNDTTAVDDADGTPTVIVNSSGDTVNLDLGYPVSTASTGVVPATDWALLLDIDSADFVIADDIVAGSVIVYPTGDVPTALTDDCIVYYQETTDAAVKPTMTVVDCL